MLNTDSYAGTCAHTHTKEWRCLVHEWSSQIQKLVVTHITHSYGSFKEVWTWTPVRTQHLHFYLSLYRYWTCWIGLCLLFTPPQTDKKRHRRGRSRHRHLLKGAVLWRISSSHKQATGSFCIRYGECEMLRYSACDILLFSSPLIVDDRGL